MSDADVDKFAVEASTDLGGSIIQYGGDLCVFKSGRVQRIDMSPVSRSLYGCCGDRCDLALCEILCPRTECVTQPLPLLGVSASEQSGPVLKILTSEKLSQRLSGVCRKF